MSVESLLGETNFPLLSKEQERLCVCACAGSDRDFLSLLAVVQAPSSMVVCFQVGFS